MRLVYNAIARKYNVDAIHIELQEILKNHMMIEIK